MWPQRCRAHVNRRPANLHVWRDGAIAIPRQRSQNCFGIKPFRSNSLHALRVTPRHANGIARGIVQSLPILDHLRVPRHAIPILPSRRRPHDTPLQFQLRMAIPIQVQFRQTRPHQGTPFHAILCMELQFHGMAWRGVGIGLDLAWR